MRILALMAVVALVIGLIACTDVAPTAPSADLDDFAMATEMEAFGKAAQGDRSEWQLMLTGTVTDEWYDNGWVAPFEVPCMNNGEGELVKFYGTYSWYYKETMTPSGNILLNMRYDIGDDVMIVGQDTGDVWYLTNARSQFHQHTKQADGLIYFHQPDDEWFVNDSGQRMKALWVFSTVYDESFNIVSDNSKVTACTILGN